MGKVHVTVLTFVTALMLAWALPAFAENTAKVDINKANLEELMTLEGIGKTYAARIIEHREKNGPFKSPEEILQVKGIGQKMFEANKERIVVKKEKS